MKGPRADVFERLRATLDQAIALEHELEQHLSANEAAEIGGRVKELEGQFAEAERDRKELASRLVDADLSNARLLNLYVATYQLHASLELKVVMQTIGEVSVNLLGAERFVLVFKTSRDNVFDIAHHVGLEETDTLFNRGTYEGGDPLVDATLADGQLRTGPTDESQVVAVVPLIAESAVIGALVVLDLLEQKTGLGDEDRELLDLIGAHAASALVAARAYETTHRQLRTLEGLIAPHHSLAGNLADVQLPDLLQFIHFGRRTGTLRIYRDHQVAAVGLADGRIVRASISDGVRVGDALLRDGLIDKPTLDEALRRQNSATPRQSLGQVLVTMGALQESVARRAVEQHIERTIFELVTWRTGNFEFALDDQRPADQIGMDPSDFYPDLNLNTEMLLLDAMRLVDEAANPGARPAREETVDEGDTTSPVDEGSYDSAGEATEEIEAMDLEEIPEPAQPPLPPAEASQRMTGAEVLTRLRKFLLDLRQGVTSSTITATLMRVLQETAERGALLLMTRDDLVVIDAFGDTPQGWPISETLRGVRFATSASPAITACIAGERAESIPFSEAQLPKQFATAIGAPKDRAFRLFAVQGAQRIIAVVYADTFKSASPDEAELLELTIAQVGYTLENELLRRQLATTHAGSTPPQP